MLMKLFCRIMNRSARGTVQHMTWCFVWFLGGLGAVKVLFVFFCFVAGER